MSMLTLYKTMHSDSRRLKVSSRTAVLCESCAHKMAGTPRTNALQLSASTVPIFSLIYTVINGTVTGRVLVPCSESADYEEVPTAAPISLPDCVWRSMMGTCSVHQSPSQMSSDSKSTLMTHSQDN